MVIVFNINKMVVVLNINIKLATVLIRIWKGLRQPADLVGGTRMGTSCHLAYLLHIFTIAVIITGIVTQKSAQDRDLFRDYCFSETDSEFFETNLGLNISSPRH